RNRRSSSSQASASSGPLASRTAGGRSCLRMGFPSLPGYLAFATTAQTLFDVALSVLCRLAIDAPHVRRSLSSRTLQNEVFNKLHRFSKIIGTELDIARGHVCPTGVVE